MDLFKGEQQKNVDFAFLEALKMTRVDSRQRVTLIYDIACQYFIHLKDRIGDHLPTGLVVDRAIGLFHVHAHKDTCFFRYSPAFIPHLGVVIGEILEPLWSELNKISVSMRTASLAQRDEVLDDHATDSNHRKALGMTASLCRSYQQAIPLAKETERYFEDLSVVAGRSAVDHWEETISRAESIRHLDKSAMDIYGAKLNTISAPMNSAPNSPLSALEEWIDFALVVKEKQ